MNTPSPVPAVDLEPRVAQALVRLQASRAQLRAAMLPPPQTESSSSGGFGLPRRWRAMWRAWTRGSPLAGVAGTAVGALGGWWRSQPWHSTTEIAGRAVLAEVAPLVRRHPLLAVALGAAAGAALVAARPWRWEALSRRVRPLGGTLMRWTMAQLSQVPVQMALAALLAQFVADRSRGQSDAAAPPPPQPPEGASPPHSGAPGAKVYAESADSADSVRH